MYSVEHHECTYTEILHHEATQYFKTVAQVAEANDHLKRAYGEFDDLLRLPLLKHLKERIIFSGSSSLVIIDSSRRLTV